jgi:hypothetical protein
MKNYVASLLLCFILLPGWLTAQSNIAIGNWRTHFSYQNARLLALSPEQAYVASQYGMYSYHFSDNTLSVLSKLDGLSDAGISAMAYRPIADILILAYRSGVVDVLSRGDISSFTLLAEAETDELINSITYLGDSLFLATSEGVRVLRMSTDPLSIGIRESYTRLASDGEPLAIFDIAVRGDSIFLATEEGILGNSLGRDINRQDFRSWRRYGPDRGIPAMPIRHLAVYDNTLYAALDGTGIYTYENDLWQLGNLRSKDAFNSLKASALGLVATTTRQVWVLDETWQAYDLPAPQDAALGTDGTLWIADGSSGLIRLKDGQQESFYPNGPLRDDIYSIHYAGGKLISLQQGPAAFSVFESGRWVNYDSTYLQQATDTQLLRQLTDTDFLPADGHFYFGSAGSGLLRWDGADAFSLITAGQDNSLINNQISALEAENEWLWITNYSLTSPLHRYDAVEDRWQAFSPYLGTGNFPLDLVLVDDRPWILSGRGGIEEQTGENLFAYDPETNETQNVRARVAAGNLPGSLFTDLKPARDGAIWMAGNEGISYFPIPAEIFTAPQPSVVKPIFENQFLLFGVYITALAVDGGNRKWVGTREGIWLFEDDGEALVSRFTANNSPLPSDNILDITINGQSGEVFILTDKGLVSYRGTASEGGPMHQDVKIFPNPILPDFAGQVGIEGLVTDADVKITTISGRLVRQIEASGGTATWDVLDYNGSRVAPGVYLVFSASDDGSETFIGKIAVIN